MEEREVEEECEEMSQPERQEDLRRMIWRSLGEDRTDVKHKDHFLVWPVASATGFHFSDGITLVILNIYSMTCNVSNSEYGMGVILGVTAIVTGVLATHASIFKLRRVVYALMVFCCVSIVLGLLFLVILAVTASNDARKQDESSRVLNISMAAICGAESVISMVALITISLTRRPEESDLAGEMEIPASARTPTMPPPPPPYTISNGFSLHIAPPPYEPPDNEPRDGTDAEVPVIVDEDIHSSPA